MRWLTAVPILFGVAHAAPRQSNPAFLGIQFGPAPNGCVIELVTAGGPAADAKIEAGDVILAFDTIALDAAQPCDQLVANITTHSPGDRIRVDLQRSAVHRTVDVTLSTRAITTISARPARRSSSAGSPIAAAVVRTSSIGSRTASRVARRPACSCSR